MVRKTIKGLEKEIEELKAENRMTTEKYCERYNVHVNMIREQNRVIEALKEIIDGKE